MNPDLTNIKWIIIDWGRTLHDNDHSELFSDSLETIEYLYAKKYKLGIISLAGHQSGSSKIERINEIDKYNLNKYFEFIDVTDQSKDKLYQEAIDKWQIRPSELAVLDDRTIRGIKWANMVGAVSIWLRRGKFAHELPNKDTGKPTLIINTLSDLQRVL